MPNVCLFYEWFISVLMLQIKTVCTTAALYSGNDQ